MKKLFIVFLTLTSFTLHSYGQTAKEILTRMETVFETQGGGIEMIVDSKLPLLGRNVSKTYSLGDKVRMETKMMGVEFITWSDNQFTWTYIIDLNQVEITHVKEDAEEITDDTKLFIGFADGYDVSIKNETADTWLIAGVKSKSNTDKEAPKKKEVIIAKETYLPISLKAQGSGITVEMKDIKFGVTEKDVIFNPNDYPGVKIIDKR